MRGEYFNSQSIKQTRLTTCLVQEMTAVEEKVRELQERVEALMIVIVQNVTASSEEAQVIAAGWEIEADLKNLFEYVFSIHMKRQRLTRLNDSAL